MKIFLGYPREHETTAWEVYHFLKSADDDVWFDKVSLVAGVEWDRERERGQREADLVVHLLSEAALRRTGVVHREIRQSLRLVEDQPLGALYIISIRLDAMKMPVELTRFQYFDFAEGWQRDLRVAVEKRREQLTGHTHPGTSEPQVTEEKPLSGVEKIEFEDITDAYECRGEYLRYGDDGLYWAYVNSAIAGESLGRFYGTRADFRMLFLDDGPNEHGMKHEWSLTAEEVFRADDIVSVRFYTYLGFAGAAHPNHYITTMNFLGEQFGSPAIDTLLEFSVENARRVLTYCQKVIIAESEGEIEEGSFFEMYADTDEAVWKLLAQYTIDRQGITFNFSPYDVLPFVFGSHEVRVPWRFIEEMIAARYKPLAEKLSGISAE